MAEGLWNEAKKPSAILAIIIAIVAIPISMYFTSLAEKRGAPIYDVQQVIAFDQAKLANVSNDSESLLYVVDNKGVKINKTVYVATVKLWNSGSANIKPEDVRIPFQIKLSGTNNIIKFREIKETNDNMDHFSLSNDETHNISWTNFDPTQGVTISIVYASDVESKISVVGYAVNSKNIQIADINTSGVFDSRPFSQVSRGLLIMFGVSLSDRFTNGFFKKFHKSSSKDLLFGIFGLVISFVTFLYLLALIGTSSHVSYAPF